MHKIENAEVFHSDLFQNVNGKFDTIIFAVPYFDGNPKDILELGVLRRKSMTQMCRS